MCMSCVLYNMYRSVSQHTLSAGISGQAGPGVHHVGARGQQMISSKLRHSMAHTRIPKLWCDICEAMTVLSPDLVAKEPCQIL